jgi:propanediol dehydratase large subunit
MTHAIDAIVGIQPPFNMIVLIALIAATVGLVGAAVTQIRHWACHRQELDLKRELIDRGLSADEIVKVIEASGLDDSTPNWGEIIAKTGGDTDAQTSAVINAGGAVC